MILVFLLLLGCVAGRQISLLVILGNNTAGVLEQPKWQAALTPMFVTPTFMNDSQYQFGREKNFDAVLITSSVNRTVLCGRQTIFINGTLDACRNDTVAVFNGTYMDVNGTVFNSTYNVTSLSCINGTAAVNYTQEVDPCPISLTTVPLIVSNSDMMAALDMLVAVNVSSSANVTSTKQRPPALTIVADDPLAAGFSVGTQVFLYPLPPFYNTSFTNCTFYNGTFFNGTLNNGTINCTTYNVSMNATTYPAIEGGVPVAACSPIATGGNVTAIFDCPLGGTSANGTFSGRRIGFFVSTEGVINQTAIGSNGTSFIRAWVQQLIPVLTVTGDGASTYTAPCGQFLSFNVSMATQNCIPLWSNETVLVQYFNTSNLNTAVFSQTLTLTGSNALAVTAPVLGTSGQTYVVRVNTTSFPLIGARIVANVTAPAVYVNVTQVPGLVLYNTSFVINGTIMGGAGCLPNYTTGLIANTLFGPGKLFPASTTVSLVQTAANWTVQFTNWGFFSFTPLSNVKQINPPNNVSQVNNTAPIFTVLVLGPPASAPVSIVADTAVQLTNITVTLRDANGTTVSLWPTTRVSMNVTQNGVNVQTNLTFTLVRGIGGISINVTTAGTYNVSMFIYGQIPTPAANASANATASNATLSAPVMFTVSAPFTVVAGPARRFAWVDLPAPFVVLSGVNYTTTFLVTDIYGNNQTFIPGVNTSTVDISKRAPVGAYVTTGQLVQPNLALPLVSLSNLYVNRIGNYSVSIGLSNVVGPGFNFTALIGNPGDTICLQTPLTTNVRASFSVRAQLVDTVGQFFNVSSLTGAVYTSVPVTGNSSNIPMTDGTGIWNFPVVNINNTGSFNMAVRIGNANPCNFTFVVTGDAMAFYSVNASVNGTANVNFTVTADMRDSNDNYDNTHRNIYIGPTNLFNSTVATCDGLTTCHFQLTGRTTLAGLQTFVITTMDATYSRNILIFPGLGTRLVVDPLDFTTVVAGQIMPAVTVRGADTWLNPVPITLSSVGLNSTNASIPLVGATANVANGTAVFTTLNATRTGTIGFMPQNGGSFNGAHVGSTTTVVVTPAALFRIQFVQNPPADVTAGSAVTAKLTSYDIYGNFRYDDTSSVINCSLVYPDGMRLYSAAKYSPASGGAALFSIVPSRSSPDMVVACWYVLSTPTNASAVLATANSTAFTIIPSAPAYIRGSPPRNSVAPLETIPPFDMCLFDVYNNSYLLPLSLTLSVNIATDFTGVKTQSTTPESNGCAHFSGLTLRLAPQSYILTVKLDTPALSISFPFVTTIIGNVTYFLVSGSGDTALEGADYTATLPAIEIDPRDQGDNGFTSNYVVNITVYPLYASLPLAHHTLTLNGRTTVTTITTQAAGNVSVGVTLWNSELQAAFEVVRPTFTVAMATQPVMVFDEDTPFAFDVFGTFGQPVSVLATTCLSTPTAQGDANPSPPATRVSFPQGLDYETMAPVGPFIDIQANKTCTVTLGFLGYQQTLTLGIEDINDPPIVTLVIVPVTLLNYTHVSIAAVDADRDVLTYTVTSVPDLEVTVNSEAAGVFTPLAIGSAFNDPNVYVYARLGTFVQNMTYTVTDNRSPLQDGKLQIDVQVPCVAHTALNVIGLCLCDSASYLDANQVCQGCPEGTYWLGPNSTDLNPCPGCPACGYCAGSDTPVVPAAGCYQTGALAFSPCYPAEICLQGGTCLAGHINPKEGCNACEKGWYMDSGRCIECKAGAFLFFVILVILMVIVCALLLRVARKATAYFTSASVGFNFMQVMIVVAALDLSWPPVVKDFFNFLSFLNFNIELFQPKCALAGGDISYQLIWSLRLILPVFFGLIFLASYGLVKAYASVRDGIHEGLHPWVKKWPKYSTADLYIFKSLVTNGFFALLVLVYLTVVSTALEIFSCTSGRVAAAPEISCYSPQWYTMLAEAILAIVGYGIGVPVAFMTLMYRNRRQLGSELIIVKYGLLYRKFKPRMYNWEVVLLARKLGIVIGLLLFRNSIAVAILAIVVLLFGLVLNLVFRPYRSRRVNNLETIHMVCGIIVLIFGCILFSIKGDSSAVTQNAVGVLVILIIIANILLIFVVVVLELRYQFRLLKHGVQRGFASDELVVSDGFFTCDFKIVEQARNLMGTTCTVILESSSTCRLRAEMWDDVKGEMVDLGSGNFGVMVQTNGKYHSLSAYFRVPGRYSLRMFATRANEGIMISGPVEARQRTITTSNPLASMDSGNYVMMNTFRPGGDGKMLMTPIQREGVAALPEQVDSADSGVHPSLEPNSFTGVEEEKPLDDGAPRPSRTWRERLQLVFKFVFSDYSLNGVYPELAYTLNSDTQPPSLVTFPSIEPSFRKRGGMIVHPRFREMTMNRKLRILVRINDVQSLLIARDRPMSDESPGSILIPESKDHPGVYEDTITFNKPGPLAFWARYTPEACAEMNITYGVYQRCGRVEVLEVQSGWDDDFDVERAIVSHLIRHQAHRDTETTVYDAKESDDPPLKEQVFMNQRGIVLEPRDRVIYTGGKIKFRIKLPGAISVSCSLNKPTSQVDGFPLFKSDDDIWFTEATFTEKEIGQMGVWAVFATLRDRGSRNMDAPSGTGDPTAALQTFEFDEEHKSAMVASSKPRASEFTKALEYEVRPPAS